MGSQITYRINHGIVSSDGSSPLSGSYYEAGSANLVINQVFAAAGSLQLVSVAFGAPGQTSGALQAIELVANQNLVIQSNTNGAIGVQMVTATGSPTGGTFALAFKGAIADGLAYNISAATLQTALRALSTIGGTNVTCTGGPLPGTAITCTFSGSVVAVTVPVMTVNYAGLTGGSSPTIVAANGVSAPQDVIPLIGGNPLVWSITPGYSACPFLGAVTAFYVTNTPAATLNGRILTY